jgi:hypothetical protein
MAANIASVAAWLAMAGQGKTRFNKAVTLLGAAPEIPQWCDDPSPR